MKLSSYKLQPKLTEKYLNEFYEALYQATEKDSLVDFVDHLFTPTEIEAFAKRIAILKRLRKGLPYWEIKDEVKVTNATITRMANILQKASEHFIRLLDDLLEQDELYEKRKKESKYTKGSKKLYAKRLG